MTPHDRIRRYAQLGMVGGLLLWALLCFLIGVSPKLARLRRAEAQLADAGKQLREMKQEIENASIAGTPAPGESRYEKFGILGADEEQLFLSDLIDFCKETGNALNTVRRADQPRSATQTGQQETRTGPTGAPVASGTQGQEQTPAAAASGPQPIVEKVPHTVSYSGTFLSSFYLLRTLEAYKRLLTVERMEISIDPRLGYPRVTGNITIDLYLVRNGGQPPSAGAARAGGASTSPPQGAGVTPAQAPGRSRAGTGA